MTSTHVRAHVFAATTVSAAVTTYGVAGGVQTEYDPTLVMAVAVVLATISGAVTFVVASHQVWRGKRDLLRPVVWAAVVAWTASLSLLFDHPASLRSRVVANSVTIAGIQFVSFAGYWGVYHLVDR
jgi:hypothetical protein